MEKLLIALDPSFVRTGIAIYAENKIVITEVKGKEKLGKDTFSKSFEGIYQESKKLTESIVKEINDRCTEFMSEYIRPYIEIISECPPPQGSYAPGLYALDIRLFSEYTNLAHQVFRVYPNYLGHLHGKRKYNKSESVVLANKILEGFEVDLKTKRLSHDAAEAVLFLSRLLYVNDIQSGRIKEIIPNIVNRKEEIVSSL